MQTVPTRTYTGEAAVDKHNRTYMARGLNAGMQACTDLMGRSRCSLRAAGPRPPTCGIRESDRAGG